MALNQLHEVHRRSAARSFHWRPVAELLRAKTSVRQDGQKGRQPLLEVNDEDSAMRRAPKEG